MDYSAYRRIEITRAERILTVTLNNPPSNTINFELHEELSRIFDDIQRDSDADIVILTGTGEAFSFGGDIPMMQKRIDDPELHLRKNLELRRTIFGLLELEKPVICKINGDCVGFGLTLALYCDVVFASDRARLGDPHVKVGYSTGDGAAVIWPHLVGFSKAKEWLMTGDLMTAAEAERIGLIGHSVPHDELDARVNAFAQRLANGAARAIKYTKVSINVGLRQLVMASHDAGLAYQAITNTHSDHAEAVNAFVERRDPKFTGRY